MQQLMSVLIRESKSLFLRDSSAAADPPAHQGQSDGPPVAAETLSEQLRPRSRASRPPPAPMMDHRPSPRQSASPRRVSDPIYDNCPSPGGDRRSLEPPSTTPPLLLSSPASVPTLPDSWDVPCWGGEPEGRASLSSGSSREELVVRNAHESTLSVYDNLDIPASTAGANDTHTRPAPQPPPPPPEDSGDSSSWSSCEIVLEEAKPGGGLGTGSSFGPFTLRAEPSDPPPDFLLPLASPDLDPAASPATMRYLVVGLKQQMARQKEDYEAQIRRLELNPNAFRSKFFSRF